MTTDVVLAATHPDNLPKRTSEASSRIERPRASIDRILAERITSIHLSLAIVFALIVPIWMHTDVVFKHRGASLLLGGATSLAFTFAWLFRRRVLASPRLAHKALGLTIALVLVNCLFHLDQTGRHEATVGFIFLVMGAALTIASAPMMVATVVLTLGSWSVLAYQSWNAAEWVSPSLNLGAACLLALAAQLTRSKSVYQREFNRYRAQKNAQAIAATLTQAKQEIRSRRKAQGILRQAQARKSAILDAALDAIVTLDRHGHILDFNRCAERMFGARREDVAGMRFGDIFVPHELRESHRAGLVRYVESRVGVVVNQRIEIEALRVDGEKFPAELAVCPIEVGGDIEFTAYIRDLSQIRAAQEALEASAREQGRVAREIQEHLLAGQIPKCPGLRIASTFIACDDVGGDFLDFACTERGLDIMVGDVMGKGVPAALVGAVVKSSFVTLRATSNPKGTSVSELVKEVGREYGAELYDLDRFVTLVYARIDLDSRTLAFVDCGHTKTVRANPLHGLEFLHGSNAPIGIVLNENIIEDTVPIRGGDVFVFYSDGLIEAENEDSDLFSQERVGEIVLEHIEGTPDEILEALESAVRDFTGSKTFEDDFTVAVIRVD